MYLCNYIPSGKVTEQLLNITTFNRSINYNIYDWAIFHSHVKLPEGTCGDINGNLGEHLKHMVARYGDILECDGYELI